MLELEALEELARLSAPHVRLNDDRTAIFRLVLSCDRLDLNEGTKTASVSATLDTIAPRSRDANGRARLSFPSFEESNFFH